MEKFRILLLILGALLIARLLVPLDANASGAPPSVIEGQNLASTETQSIVLKHDKTYAVVFLSTKCPCSLSHLTELKALVRDYPDVQLIGVHSNLDEDVTEAQAYFKAHALGFPVVQDRDNILANRFGAFKTPHAFIVSKGEIVYRGGVSDRQTYAPDARKYLRDALEDLKQNRVVKTSSTRTLGCAIPRS